MATRGKPLDAQTIMMIQRLRPSLSLRQTARAARVSLPTVVKYARSMPTRKQ